MFDEIAFDISTMCDFSGRADTMVHRFASFHIMLQENGVLYISSHDEVYKQALGKAGFSEVFEMRVRDLGGNTTVDMLDFPPDYIILVAIKRRMELISN